MIKAPLLFLAVAHVPFPNEGRLVSRLLQKLGKKGQRLAHRIVIIHNMMVVRVEPGQNRGPARRAQRGRDVGIFKMNSLSRQSVKIRRLEKRMPQKAHRIVSMVIGENHHDIGPLRRLGGPQHHKNPNDQ